MNGCMDGFTSCVYGLLICGQEENNMDKRHEEIRVREDEGIVSCL